MTRFVRLTRPSGTPVLVNPEHVVSLGPGANQNETVITTVNGTLIVIGSLLQLALDLTVTNP